MSGFGRNVIPRRAHKERAQPAGRVARHGLLEKKRDWKLRAKNYHRREARVKLLREKAAFRNPDEFYFGMINSGTNSGRVRKRQDVGDAIPVAHRDAAQKLLVETRDRGYVSVKNGLEEGKVEKLKKGLHFLDAARAAKRKHVLFVDNETELESFSESKHLRERERELDELSHSDAPESALSSKSVQKNRRAYKELEQRLERKGKLQTVLHDMDLQKRLLGKGSRRRVRKANPEKGTPAIYKWRQQRKR